MQGMGGKWEDDEEGGKEDEQRGNCTRISHSRSHFTQTLTQSRAIGAHTSVFVSVRATGAAPQLEVLIESHLLPHARLLLPPLLQRKSMNPKCQVRLNWILP